MRVGPSVGIIRPARRPPRMGRARAAAGGARRPRAGRRRGPVLARRRLAHPPAPRRSSLVARRPGDGVVAASARGGAPARFADLGCGIGSVLLLLAWRFPAASRLGLEAQEMSVELGAPLARVERRRRTRCEVRRGDLRDRPLVPEGAVFDLVTGTPPYLPPGAGRESRRVQCGPCRFEHRGGDRGLLPRGCAAARTRRRLRRVRGGTPDRVRPSRRRERRARARVAARRRAASGQAAAVRGARHAAGVRGRHDCAIEPAHGPRWARPTDTGVPRAAGRHGHAALSRARARQAAGSIDRSTYGSRPPWR